MTNKTRQPGRPTGARNTDTQDRIIRAACDLFARHGIKGTSNQMLATRARVTPAMVHYYFKRREDLHQAVMDHAFYSAREKLEGANSLQEWVVIFHEHLMQHPWIPHLMLREVIPHGGQLQAIFLEHVGPAIFKSIREQVTAQVRVHNAGTGFDVDRHIVLLMGMVVYPFIGRELAEKVTGKKFDDRMMVSFREDALSLFNAGISAHTGTLQQGAGK